MNEGILPGMDSGLGRHLSLTTALAYENFFGCLYNIGHREPHTLDVLTRQV